jgi:hypothetical protein
MASLKKTILGRLNGGIGDIVFKTINGKNYVASKPGDIKVSNSPRSIEIRSKFKISIRFALAVNGMNLLKEIWNTAKPAGISSANFIVRTNYPQITQSGINNSASLVPGFGFSVDNPVLSINSDRLRVDINALGDNTGIVLASEPNLRMMSVVLLTSPTDPSQKPYEFISLSSLNVPTVLDAALSFIANLSSQQEQIFNQYQTRKIFCTIVSLNAEQNAVHYSSTFTG